MHMLRTGAVVIALLSVPAFGEEWRPFPKALPRLSECERAEREGGQAMRKFTERFVSTQEYCIGYRYIEVNFSDLAHAPGMRPSYSGGEYTILMLRYRVMPRRIRDTDWLTVCDWKPEKLYWRRVYADGKPLTRQFALMRTRSWHALWLRHRWQWRELPQGAMPFAGEPEEAQRILNGIIR